MARSRVTADSPPIRITRIPTSLKEVLAEEELDEFRLQYTDLQWRWANEFVKDFNAAAAAARAGCADPIVGRQFWANPKIRQLVAHIRMEMRERYRIDQAWIIDRFLEIYSRSMEAVPVLDRQGEPTGIWKCDYAAAIKCIEHIGKMTGHVKDKIEVTGKDGKAIEHSHTHVSVGLTADDLQKLDLDTRTKLLELIRMKKKEAQAISDKPTNSQVIVQKSDDDFLDDEL